MERAAGIEPACLTWKDSALPLSYARLVMRSNPLIYSISIKYFYVFLNARYVTNMSQTTNLNR